MFFQKSEIKKLKEESEKEHEYSSFNTELKINELYEKIDELNLQNIDLSVIFFNLNLW